ncbi:NACHT domain-containing protein [Bradyrhizobium oligotrophicum]|uniref:NACHT domain-containing protein n=1 Tax=Bradyrhizobium oligotrophicum TaxID=44255 RepID=UPI003EBC477A
MPSLNWATFESLSGAATANFEMVCRGTMRRHYSQYGDFRALSNQPGVEFHLKLLAPCALGAAGRWYGWQCRWYDLPSGTDLGSTRRQKIEKAIETTEKQLPGITDWVLWTRHPLTKRDQQWFYAIQTRMKLVLWSSVELEEHLTGPALLFREAYFGELIFTPDTLRELHDKTVEPIRTRWRPEVHQAVEAERVLHRSLGEISAWSNIVDIKGQIDDDIAETTAGSDNLPDGLKRQVAELIKRAADASTFLDQCYVALQTGQFDIIKQSSAATIAPIEKERRIAHQLRALRHKAALHVANLLADMVRAQKTVVRLNQAMGNKLVAVVADAGCGKTQLAAQLTAPRSSRSAGVLLRGKFLAAGKNLDDLARLITIRGKPLSSFEALIAAVDAAAQRGFARLPIVIDGLNEAEDPRDWKDQLASLTVALADYENIQIICTLRSAFADDALPEGIKRLEIPGFDDDLSAAVRAYFAYYKIDAADAELPVELLNHPLTLRIFCEVTNPDRKHRADVTAIPGSLAVLFERYLEQVANRISELSPTTCRLFPADVAAALNKIGQNLWTEHRRDIGMNELRQLLGDEGRQWDHSLVAALEHEGVLFREPGDQPGPGNMSVVFDALAGHVIADALLAEFSGEKFDAWLASSPTLAALRTGPDEESILERLGTRIANILPNKSALRVQAAVRRFSQSRRREYHPLATDIFRSLVGLTPRRMNRKQLWPLLKGQPRANALTEAAFLDNAHLDQETVSELVNLVRQPSLRHRDLLFRLFATRAAQAHPLNSDFLDRVLRPMSLPDRDLRWSEWLRRDQTDRSRDSERLANRWKSGKLWERSDALRARWIMWTLTSTDRFRRDWSTKALYWFGCHDPESLFSLTLESLSINDPYVPERMLASCYGVAMNLWADPRGKKIQEALPSFANQLVDAMFIKDAPHPTFHVLTRDYALGVIALARKIQPDCFNGDRQACLQPPFRSASPFPPVAQITDQQVAGAGAAMHMDFENYTLGRLIRDRSNYDFKNETYKEVRRQIEYRINNLGYVAARFETVDRMIAESAWRAEGRGRSKADRYGKKYSWIAFFEMYGVRQDAGELSDWARNRPSDADIDPSFPEKPKFHLPALADLFGGSPVEPPDWLANGPTPDYQKLVQCDEIDSQHGPWILLEGFVEQTAPTDHRQVFTFLRGIIAERKNTAEILARFHAIDYPGNSTIPEPGDDHYTYAGEIPWSNHFARRLRDADGTAGPDIENGFVVFENGRWTDGIPIEIPACGYAWESYHSELNQVGRTTVLAPALSQRLELVNHQGEWDLYEETGGLATIYREFRGANDSFNSRLLYLRADLLRTYLSPDQDFLWLLWGERNFHSKAFDSKLREAFTDHSHIHRRSSRWDLS